MAGAYWHAMTLAGDLGSILPLARATLVIVMPTVGKSEADSRKPQAYAAPQLRSGVGRHEP